MFINLTLFNAAVGEPARPVFINTDQITYINQVERQQYYYENELMRKMEPMPVTIISFAAGVGEESDSVMVTESMDQIKTMLSVR